MERNIFRQVQQHLVGTILITLLALLLGAIFSAFATNHLIIMLGGVLLVLLGLVLLFFWFKLRELATQHKEDIHKIRCGLLVSLQRISRHTRLIGFILGLTPGLLTASLMALALVYRGYGLADIRIGNRFSAVLDIAGVSILLGFLVFLLTEVLIIRFLIRFLRLTIPAARCYAVLQRIERQKPPDQTNRPYSFETNASNRDIIRDSRILDYIARRSSLMVVRRRFHYVLKGASVSQERQHEEASHHAFSQDGLPQVSFKNDRLAKEANELWASGEKMRFWQGIGGRTPAIPDEVSKLFNNQMDLLFNNGNGFQISNVHGPQLVTLVIKGPPGAGKSTLALQMSVALARQGNIAIYYSLEEEREGLIQAARNFRWKEVERVPAYRASDGQNMQQEDAWYGGVEQLDMLSDQRQLKSCIEAIQRTVPEHFDGPIGAVIVSSLGYRAMNVNARFRRLEHDWRKMNDFTPRSVVIDSLEGFANVGIELEGQIAVPRDKLLALKEFFRDRCQMLVILVEDDNSGKPGFPDFVADAVIQLGRDREDNYTFLYAEIVKARNQNHALGRHQIKIRSARDLQYATGALGEAARRWKPGLSLIPSIDYRLYQSQQQSTYNRHVLNSGLSGLNEMLDDEIPEPETLDRPPTENKQDAPVRYGLRRYSSSALLGSNGTAKSLLAMNFLIEGVRENTKTLLISLRDDEGIISTRVIPQEDGKMRFSWQTFSEESTGKASGVRTLHHQFEWDLAEIVAWAETSHRFSRLPYVFFEGPTTYEIFRTSSYFQKQAKIANDFLRDVAGMYKRFCEEKSSSAITAQGDNPCAVLEARYREVVRQFRENVIQAAQEEYIGRPQSNNYAKGEEWPVAPTLRCDQESGPPALVWGSKAVSEVARGNVPSLLTIMSFRPGNISPAEFIDRVLHEIGAPNQPSLYERVVFDDVSQLHQRYPLLSKSTLFLPTLIDIFKAAGITSLFIADEVADQPVLSRADSHGLHVIADHIIRTHIEKKKGDRKRAIVVEVEVRPDKERQYPHILRFEESQRSWDASVSAPHRQSLKLARDTVPQTGGSAGEGA